MEFNDKDFAQLQNVLRCLKQGKFDLSGEEAMAFAQTFTWAIQLSNNMKQEILLKKQQSQIIASVNSESPNKDVAKPKRTKKVVE